MCVVEVEGVSYDVVGKVGCYDWGVFWVVDVGCFFVFVLCVGYGVSYIGGFERFGGEDQVDDVEYVFVSVCLCSFWQVIELGFCVDFCELLYEGCYVLVFVLRIVIG